MGCAVVQDTRRAPAHGTTSAVAQSVMPHLRINLLSTVLVFEKAASASSALPALQISALCLLT